MKKVFIVLAAAVFVFGTVSCTKTCKCKTYALGVAGPEQEVALGEGYKKCADMTTIVEDEMFGKTGLECK